MSNEAWVSILIAIVAGSFTLLGIFIEHSLHEKREKKRLFKALFDEVKLNIYLAENTLTEIKSVEKMKTKKFPYRPLYTQSYSNIRSSGYLADLNEELRVRLEKTFDEVYAYNRDAAYKYWHEASLKRLFDELSYIKNKLPH